MRSEGTSKGHGVCPASQLVINQLPKVSLSLSLSLSLTVATSSLSMKQDFSVSSSCPEPFQLLVLTIILPPIQPVQYGHSIQTVSPKVNNEIAAATSMLTGRRINNSKHFLGKFLEFGHSRFLVVFREVDLRAAYVKTP